MRAHWCRRCKNHHCYSRTGAGGARTSTVTVALVREPALLQSHWCENQHCYSRTGARTSTVAVALVREPALLQSHWCENLHHCRTVLVFALGYASCYRYAEGCTDNKARNQCETGSNGYAREKTKSCGAAEMANRPTPLRTGAGGARTSTVTVALVRKPALLQSHWCENQHCYSRTGARTSTVTVALVREPALLQSC